jgi:hypothetical protein
MSETNKFLSYANDFRPSESQATVENFIHIKNVSCQQWDQVMRFAFEMSLKMRQIKRQNPLSLMCVVE